MPETFPNHINWPNETHHNSPHNPCHTSVLHNCQIMAAMRAINTATLASEIPLIVLSENCWAPGLCRLDIVQQSQLK